MSVSKETTIWCDSCSVWEQSSDRAVVLRRELKRRRWAQEGAKDYCPECSRERELNGRQEGVTMPDNSTLVEVFLAEKVKCSGCGWEGKRKDLDHGTVSRPEDGWIPEVVYKCPKCGKEIL